MGEDSEGGGISYKFLIHSVIYLLLVNPVDNTLTNECFDINRFKGDCVLHEI